MKSKLHYFFMMLTLLAGVYQVAAQVTAFTYQGRLNDGTNPASGNYDLQFTLYDANTNGNVFGLLTNTATGINNGLFLATLDFGGVFNGSNYWVEIAARTNGNGAFTILSPRQQITPTPQAFYAANAGSATMATTASSASSVLAANITGTIPDTRLSANVALLNSSNVFSGAVQFNNTNNSFSGSFTGNGSGLTIAMQGYDSFTGKPNGPLTTVDSGQQWSQFVADPKNIAIITNGFLTMRFVTNGNVTCHNFLTASGAINFMSADFSWNT